MRISVLSIIICFILLSTSCREDERIIPSTPNQVTPGVSGTSVKGFFLLNEGNMGSNKATLDYFDYETYQLHDYFIRGKNRAGAGSDYIYRKMMYEWFGEPYVVKYLMEY